MYDDDVLISEQAALDNGRRIILPQASMSRMTIEGKKRNKNIVFLLTTLTLCVYVCVCVCVCVCVSVFCHQTLRDFGREVAKWRHLSTTSEEIRQMCRQRERDSCQVFSVLYFPMHWYLPRTRVSMWLCVCLFACVCVVMKNASHPRHCEVNVWMKTHSAVQKHVHTFGEITFISEGETSSAEILSAFVSSAWYLEIHSADSLNGTT